MTITSNDLVLKDLEYKIDMSSGNGVWLDRSFSFKSGDSISFHIKVNARPEMSLLDLHRESLELAIRMLQARLDPKPVQEPANGSAASRLA
ncbi:hypothetical protein [Glaciimonas sp. PCH181]|uniref:hypothetical protein n=1 Tax=Glaciimonas sp. PCH181 TaxID=2133943 RepID=UPI0011B1E34D|nr:hypothetical protein [Glaciimonas sp. PCH181]